MLCPARPQPLPRQGCISRPSAAAFPVPAAVAGPFLPVPRSHHTPPPAALPGASPVRGACRPHSSSRASGSDAHPARPLPACPQELQTCSFLRGPQRRAGWGAALPPWSYRRHACLALRLRPAGSRCRSRCPSCFPAQEPVVFKLGVPPVPPPAPSCRPERMEDTPSSPGPSLPCFLSPVKVHDIGRHDKRFVGCSDKVKVRFHGGEHT